MDLDRIRLDFPILERRLMTRQGNEVPLVFMDHGASTHAPKPVLDAVLHLHSHSYANIHRGLHTLSQESSDLFDNAADVFARFIGADREHGDFVFVQNTTAALDLAAHLMKGTEGATLTTLAEHHSNDLVHRRAGNVLHAEVDEHGRIDLADVEAKLRDHDVKLLAVTGASNVTGYMPPIHRLARMAHEHGARILVDAAQLYAHAPIDIKAPDHPEHIDLLAAAGHKAYAPFGSAFLHAPKELIDAAPPYIPGGGTVDWVTADDALFTKGVDRHMGGTPNISGVVAFAAATEYLMSIGMENVRAHEVEMMERAMPRFAELEDRYGVELLGPTDPGEKTAVFTFVVPGVRHEAASRLLNDEHGIATRNGCFCAHPLLHRLLGLEDTSKWTDAIARGEEIPLPGATRATVGLYNTLSEMDRLLEAIKTIAAGLETPALPGQG